MKNAIIHVNLIDTYDYIAMIKNQSKTNKECMNSIFK